MARPLNLRVRISIDYLDKDLIETSIKYIISGGVMVIKRLFIDIASDLDEIVKTNNRDIWKSYESHKDQT